ncbi:hypothetical protein HMI54_014530 [Coelomomyces lativittatus]|nr:hypothetical protein HMI54_014530 [Coelomomyces lativittatus]
MESPKGNTRISMSKVERYRPVACFYLLLTFSFLSFLIFILPMYSQLFTWSSPFSHYFALSFLAALGSLLCFSCLWNYVLVSISPPGSPIALKHLKEQEKSIGHSLSTMHTDNKEAVIIDIPEETDMKLSVQVGTVHV